MLKPLYVRVLSNTEREQLEHSRDSSSDEEAVRSRIILLSSSGRTASEIGEEVGVHPSNVKKWIRRFNDEGITGIALRKRGPHGGPRPTFSTSQIEAILDLHKERPASLGYSFKEWTPQKLAKAAIERGLVQSISHVTVRQLLKRQEEQRRQSREVDAAMVEAGSRLDSIHRELGFGKDFQLGKAAFARADYKAAVEHLTVALRSTQSPEQEAAVRVLLTQSLEESSCYEDALQVISTYEDPAALADVSPATRARVKLRLGWVNSWIRNYPKAIASLNEAKKYFHEVKDEIGVSEVHYALGRTYISIDEFRIARDHLLTAASLHRSVVDKELLARIYDQLGTVDFNEGAFSSAFENYKRALELAEGASNPNVLGAVLLNLGTAHDEGCMGGRSESAEYFRRSIECLKQGGHKDYLAFAYNNLAGNLRDSGSWDEAIENLTRSIEIASQFPDRRADVTARITLAEILYARGRLAEAEDHLTHCLEAGTDKWLESNALRVQSQIYRSSGRTEEALEAVRQALRYSTAIGDLHGVTLAQVELAEFHLCQGGLDQAREYLELAQGRLKEEKSLLLSGLIQRLAGRLEAASGRLAEAKQHIAQSISIFTTTEIPYEAARSYYQMGLLLMQAGDLEGAETQLRSACRVFEGLGAGPDLEATTKAVDAIERGAHRELRAGIPSTNDVLLMQRLIEASASRDLLLQELASIVYENFPVASVTICRLDDGDRLVPHVAWGIGIQEAEERLETYDFSFERVGSEDGRYIALKLGEGYGDSIGVVINAKQRVDLGRLQPLLRQVELGLETCSLRSTSRVPESIKLDHRIQTIIPGFICCSAVMSDVVERIHKIRTSDVTVLITGESGTGKELVARAIHAMSARARAIFLPFNCTATPKEIIDSQLFGHRRGAFTGATANYPGIIRAADGGTLFLDEIGDLSLEVQPKLMRFLQESEIQPLGETRPIRVDVRVLAATNTELERAVEEGRFREDLFHRLNIIRIHVPPLRERPEEVPVLAEYFLDQFSSRSGRKDISFSQEAIDALTEYDWPGNIRQLRNEIERVLAYSSDGAMVSTAELSPEVARMQRSRIGAPLRSMAAGASFGSAGGNNGTNGRVGGRTVQIPGSMNLKQATACLERQMIEEALVRNRNNLSRTAVELGLSRRGLRLKLGQLGIDRSVLLA